MMIECDNDGDDVGDRDVDRRLWNRLVIAPSHGDGNDDHASAAGGHCAGGGQGGKDQVGNHN